MKDKLEFKNIKIDWPSFIEGSPFLQREFQSWIKVRRPRIKSKNRLCYTFLRYKFGLKWIRFVQENKLENYIKFDFVLRSNWINYPEGDS